MAEEKCFSCRNSATKGPIVNLEDAPTCEDCGAFYHPSCYVRAIEEKKSAGKVPKCCVLGFSFPNTLDKATFSREIKALRTFIDDNHNTMIDKMQNLESKFDKKLVEIENKLVVQDSMLVEHEKKINDHDNQLLSVDEKLHSLENKCDSWQQDTEDIMLQKNDQWKREAAENILQEVAERKRRETNVIVYNLSGKENMTDVQLLMSNFPEAPFQASDIYARRIKPKNIKNSASASSSNAGSNTAVYPLKVFFQKQDYAHWLLLHSKQGTDHNVKCVQDRTYLQRETFSRVFTELNDRKSKGEKNLQIKFVNGIPQIKIIKENQKNKQPPTQQNPT